MHKYPDLSDYLQSTMQQISVLFIVFKMILEIALGNGLREWFLESFVLNAIQISSIQGNKK